jgi:hypothetical protein
MRSMVEGWLEQACANYPSTPPRGVPLPLCDGEDI